MNTIKHIAIENRMALDIRDVATASKKFADSSKSVDALIT